MKYTATIAATLLLASCGVSSTDGVISREKNTGGFMGLSEKSSVEVSGDSALKGVQKVIISGFKVGFIESGSAKRQAGGGFLSGGGIGGKAKGNMRLEGVSEATKNSITEAAYKDFVKELKSQGFEVVNRAAYVSSEAYKGARKYSFPYEADASGFLSKYGVTRFYQPKAFGNEGVFFMNDIQDVSGGFGFGNGESAAAGYAAENGVAVVGATYVVDFAAAGGHGGSYSMSASVQVGQNLAVKSGTVKFVTGGTSSFTSGTAALELGQPIEAGEAFGTVVEETATADRVVQEAVNVFSALAGGGSSRSKDFVIKADPVKFKKLSDAVLSQANEALLSKASTLR